MIVLMIFRVRNASGLIRIMIRSKSKTAPEAPITIPNPGG
jgi:hypothetical protein